VLLSDVEKPVDESKHMKNRFRRGRYSSCRIFFLLFSCIFI